MIFSNMITDVMFYKQKNSAFPLLMITIVALITIFSYAKYVTISVDRSQADWQGYQGIIREKTVLLSDLRDEIGYGGLIHNFKNFVSQPALKKLAARC